jgi:hypothetical protein
MIKTILAAAVLVCAAPLAASTITTITLDFGDGADFGYRGGVFGSLDDGDRSTSGDLNAAISFSGALASLGPTAGSFTLSGLTAYGAPIVWGPMGLQCAAGGTFWLFDAGDNLMLSGVIELALIAGYVTQPGANVVLATSARFTGGSLLDRVAPTPGSFRFALTAAEPPLESRSLLAGGGWPGDFEADGAGLLAVVAAPEPEGLPALGAALLLALGAVRARRVI